MPIKDLQQQQAQVGRIRIGHQVPGKNGRTRPEKLDRFRFTTPQRMLADAVAAQYGGTVEAWTPEGRPAEWEVISTATTLPVLVPPRPVTQWYELWSGAGCQRRCDGETEQISGEACKCPLDQLERADQAASGQACKVTTRLKVMLPEIPGMGVWRLDSHGFYSAIELPQTAEFLGAVTAANGYIEAFLALEQREVRRPGVGKRQFMVPALHVAVTPQQLIAGKGVLAVGGGAVPQLEGQARELTSGQPAVDVAALRDAAIEAPDVDSVRALWALAVDAKVLDVEIAGADGPDGAPTTLRALLTERGQQLKAHTEPVGEQSRDDVEARLIYAGAEQPDGFDLPAYVEQVLGGVSMEDATVEQLQQVLTSLPVPSEVVPA